MERAYSDVLNLVKPRIIGTAEIVHDEPSKFARLQGALHGMPLDREVYCRLLVNGQLWMTDADFERRTNIGFLSRAKGDVLIAGLGIGLILGVAPHCDSVTVVEKSADVIALVAPSYPLVRVVQGDIYKWNPPKDASYDTIYFDIWGDVSSDDVTDARRRLHRRFKKYLRPGGWMASWCEYAVRAAGRGR